MPRKNHKMVDGRLLKTDKSFSDLKMSQREKIAGSMRNTCLCSKQTVIDTASASMTLSFQMFMTRSSRRRSVPAK